MEFVDIVRAVAALVFVVGLIVGLAWVIKRTGLGAGGLFRKGGASNHRLRIVEVLSIDPRRKLLLIERDDTQHLLLLSATGETVVETGITAPPAEATAADSETGEAQ